jgi:predicted DNA-binding protein
MVAPQLRDAPRRRSIPKINTALRVAIDLVIRTDGYIDSQRHPTTRTVVIEEAIRVFLEQDHALCMPSPQDQKAKRSLRKINTALRLPVELLTRLDDYVDSQECSTTRTAVIEEALRAFLDRYEPEVHACKSAGISKL